MSLKFRENLLLVEYIDPILPNFLRKAQLFHDCFYPACDLSRLMTKHQSVVVRNGGSRNADLAKPSVFQVFLEHCGDATSIERGLFGKR